MRKFNIVLFVLMCFCCYIYGQDVPTPPSGSVKIGNTVYRAPDGSIWIDQGPVFKFVRVPKFSDISGFTTYTFGTGLTNTSGVVTNNLLTGLLGGQTLIGGTQSGNPLRLFSTNNATKGKIFFDNLSAYNGANNYWGFGITNPLYPVHVGSIDGFLNIGFKTSAGASAQYFDRTTGAGTFYHYRVVSGIDGGGGFGIQSAPVSSLIGGDVSDGAWATLIGFRGDGSVFGTFLSGTPSFTSAPTTSSSPGSNGQIAYDSNYWYWYAGGRWNRVPRDMTF